jgi:hypothetical protein
MKQCFIVLLAFIAFGTYGQKFDFPNEINATKTGAHINIPSTKLYIIPPEGFLVSPGLPALQKGDDALIQVMDLTGGDFYTNASTFTKDNFEQKGVTVLGFKEISINGYPAKMAFLQGDSGSVVYNIIFGDSTFSEMVMAVFPGNDNAIKGQVEKALESMYYDKGQSVDPFGAAQFRLDDSKSVFKFASFSASMYLYSVNGTKNSATDNGPYMMVMSLPAGENTPETSADLMLGSLKRYGMEVTNIKNISTQSTNGFVTYQREVYCKLNGAGALVFQHVVNIGGNIVVMQGIAHNDYPVMLVEFKKLTNTISKK